MNLADLRELLPLYADGELDAARRTQLESALANSPELRSELVLWQALRQSARRSLELTPVPGDLESMLREHLVSAKPVFRMQRVVRVGALLGMAAAVWAALLWLPRVLPLSGASRDARIDITTAERVSPELFADAFRHCGPTGHHTVGVTVSLPACDVQAKLEETRAYSIAVPDLTAYGFRLQGICECMDPLRHPTLRVVHAHYRTGDEHPALLSLFSVSTHILLADCDSPAGARANLQATGCRDVSVVKWDDRHNSFVACSNLALPQLEQIVNTLDVARLEAATPLPVAAIAPLLVPSAAP